MVSDVEVVIFRGDMKRYLKILFFCVVLIGFQSWKANAHDQIYTNSIGMEFALIPEGTFTIKWTEVTENDFGEKNEIPKQRVVTISKPFYLGRFEVTQEQWVAVMGTGSNPSEKKGRENPVEYVSWNEVQKFLKKLNEKEKGMKYRLPTNAEWEHAALAGSDSLWFFGNSPDDLDQYAWFGQDFFKNFAKPVGQKKPNPWGLYDIYGNVSEWVQDPLDVKMRRGAGRFTDPKGPATETFKVCRGGNYSSEILMTKVGTPLIFQPDVRSKSIGFRVAITIGK